MPAFVERYGTDEEAIKIGLFYCFASWGGPGFTFWQWNLARRAEKMMSPQYFAELFVREVSFYHGLKASQVYTQKYEPTSDFDHHIAFCFDFAPSPPHIPVHPRFKDVPNDFDKAFLKEVVRLFPKLKDVKSFSMNHVRWLD